MIIIDNFLRTYDALKTHILDADFDNIANPVDGVIYPFICVSIPDAVRKELIEKIIEIIGKPPENETVFIRKSPAGVNVPHIAHTDISMGRYSLMLYCNENENGGTAFIRHIETGISYYPESQDYVDLVVKDQNDLEKWAIVDMVRMKENRALIFDAGKFHCAMPIGGFGENQASRTVLTMFFS